MSLIVSRFAAWLSSPGMLPATDLADKQAHATLPLPAGTAPEDGASPSSLTGATSAADREAAYKADIQAAALVLAETFSYGTAVSEQGKLNRPTLQRMLFEIYTDDVYMFREYCENDPELSFEAFIQLLDERDSAGWDFLTLALKGEWSAERLLEHPFLR